MAAGQSCPEPLLAVVSVKNRLQVTVQSLHVPVQSIFAGAAVGVAIADAGVTDTGRPATEIDIGELLVATVSVAARAAACSAMGTVT